MIKRFLALILSICMILSLCSCNDDVAIEIIEYPDTRDYRDSAPFSIEFIDVGQGDSALVQCEGHYMLIDGGNISAGDKVYSTLTNRNIKKLDILVISHLHTDHYAGLPKALEALEGNKTIGVTLSNADKSNKDHFNELVGTLNKYKTKITIPGKESFDLGSATVEILDNSSKENNDSLVILVTYKKTSFLFTGDIGQKGQLRIADIFKDPKRQIDGAKLIKMPHHGAWNDDYGFNDSALNTLFWQYMPDYFVISVGKNNQHKHPHSETIKLLENYVLDKNQWKWSDHVLRTDELGNIIVFSDGENIIID